MLLALALVFVAILLFSIFKPILNPGLLALTFVFFISPLIENPKIGSVASLFPTSLFLTLLGVTFFFTTLNSTGLITTLLQRILTLTKPVPHLVPAILFALVAFLTALGLGNIASVALIAPLAIPLATELRISPFLMTILIVGGANASSFSPLTVPGIFTNDFIQKSGILIEKMTPTTMRWWIFWLVFLSISATSFASFLLLGGGNWLKLKKQFRNRTSSDNLQTIEPPQPSFTREQRHASYLCLVLAGLFLVGCISSLPILVGTISEPLLNITQRFGDVGFIGWLGSSLLLLTRLGSLDKGLKEVPWQTLLLISGMSTFVELLSRLGLPEAISAIVQQNIPNSLLPAAFAASSGLLSAFSSSVGVALPVFFPIVEAVSKSIESALAQTLIVAVAVGSHLVDASPLSTLGALCLAQIKDEQAQAKTYRNLLLYSFCMIPVAALLAFLLKLVF